MLPHLVDQHAASKGPHTRKHEVGLEQLLVRGWRPADRLGGQDALEHLADRHDLVDGWERDHILEVAAAVLEGHVNIAREQSLKGRDKGGVS